MGDNVPLVSVIVPTMNNVKTIRKCIGSLQCMDYPKFEIIIVDGYSKDGTDVFAAEQGCRVVYENSGSRAAALNEGLRRASGEIVAFTDSDCVVESDWLNQLVTYYDNPLVAGVGGPNNLVRMNPFSNLLLKLRFFESFRWLHASGRATEIDHNTGCNSSYRTTHLSSVGGFDSRLVAAEDVDLDLRLGKMGLKLVFTPRARIHHYKSFTPRGFVRWLYRFGYGAGILIRKHRSFVLHPFHLLVALVVPPYGVGMLAGLLGVIEDSSRLL